MCFFVHYEPPIFKVVPDCIIPWLLVSSMLGQKRTSGLEPLARFQDSNLINP
nr:MAG TPA: hypothetical protein [Caudoviricetes sp.]